MRLRDPSDREAWRQFESVYRKVIRRTVSRFGVQDADAADLEQEVFIRITKSIRNFQHDPTQAKFRTWLGHVIRSAIIDHHRRQPREQGTGLTKTHMRLAQWIDEERQDEFEKAYGRDCQSEVFRWAANRIRAEFTDSSWQAFWMTTVQNLEPKAVADHLGKSVGSIYTSRSRIIRRLREVVNEFDDDSDAMPETSFYLVESDGEAPDDT